MLHADSQIGLSAVTYLRSLAVPGWGRFDIAFHPENRIMRLVAWMMNRRSRWTGICTGDQGIFVHRSLLTRIGGVPEQPLMEDVELSRRLRRLSHPLTPRIRIITSSRRWQRDGAVRTVLRMWRFRLLYWMGRTPESLAREYYG
jgi:GT2 family glycosyltransferase